MIAAEIENEEETTESFSQHALFGPGAPVEEPLDEERVYLSIYKDIIPEKPKIKRNDNDWYIRMLCLQEWFIRCSWINKFLFLDTICQSTMGSYVLENVLKSIESINSKDVLESLSRGCTDYDFDRIPVDDNRALNEAALNEAMKEDFCWFSHLDPIIQIRVILKLLRLGGGGLIYEVYKSAEKIWKERREMIQLLAPSEVLKPAPESKLKVKDKSRLQMSKISAEKNLSSENFEFRMAKISQLARRETELLAYKKARGISGEESKAEKKGEGGENVDYLQILPIQVNRRIISYIDEKSLSGLKKVGKYWDKMIDESINEKTGRKTITGKINKIAGPRANVKADEDAEKMQEEEMIECMGESKLKEIIMKKNPRALIELEKSCQIFSRKFDVKMLDSSFFQKRCGDFDAAAGLLTCSSANNLVHFYSVRTGKRMNFSLYGFQSAVTCLTFHEDRIHVIVGCMDGSLISKDMRNNKTTASFNGHTEAVVAIFATSSNLLSASQDNTIKYFHLWSRLCLLHVDLNPYHTISTLSFRSDSSVWVFIGTVEGDLILADINTKRFITKVKLHADKINQIVYEDDFLITGSDWGNLRTWNVNSLSDNFYSRRPYYSLNMESSITCLFLLKNQIFCGCANGTVKVISLAEGKVLKIIKISSLTSILGIKITEDNFSTKLIIWHEKGIEIRSFPLGKLSSKKKAIWKDNRESKQKAPTEKSKNKTSDTVPVCFGKAHLGLIELEGKFAKKATCNGVKRPTKKTCCTLSTLRQPQAMSGIYCSDIFTDMLNLYSSDSGKNYNFKTFPRYNKP